MDPKKFAEIHANLLARVERMEMEESAERRRQGLTIKLPWGTVEARGLSVIMTLILVLLGVVAAALVLHMREVSTNGETVIRALDTMTSEQRRTTESQQELNYIITLPQDKRERLELQMPDSLRKRMGR